MSDDGKIDYAEVMRRLPHRYPFLLVDKAEDFVANTSITGIKNVTHNEPFFPGAGLDEWVGNACSTAAAHI